jgi:arylsulfatase A-like enzyme
MAANSSLLRSLKNYSLAGACASLLLLLIEWTDLNIQLTPVFRTPVERLTFTAYLSLDVVVGALIGLLVGLFALVGGKVVSLIESKLTRGRLLTTRTRFLSLLITGMLASILLSLQPQLRGYVSGLIIEAQKLPYIYGKLLPLEFYLIPVIIFGLLGACWVVLSATHYSEKSRAAKIGFPLLMLALMGAAYYIDSRDQVQLYEYTLHRSMFLLAQGAAMAFLASIYCSVELVRQRISSTAFAVKIALTILLLCSVTFTFIHFGRNQNLKTQLFTRTTQAKQHFKLAQWVLDLDRDGYSSLLGGGDADDTRADINPAQKEIPGDGIDNNQIGGDLTLEEVSAWFRERRVLHGLASPVAHHLNVVFVFIDATRADHFGAYGYSRNTTPNLDKLAAKSILFENGFSPAANTFESAARFMKSSYWDAQVESWTEVLTRSGYDTILFPERRRSMLERYVKGARVAPNSEGKYLKESIDVAIQTLSEARSDHPFCAYIYAVEPHMPYAPHKQFNFGNSLTDLYDGELAFTDHHLGRFLDWMEQSGHMKDTMIVVMADHGESLGERAVYRHSSQLYNEQTHVPIIIYVPDLSPGRVPDYVTTIDLGTTVLDAAGIACPEQYTGVTLLPLMRGEPFTHPSLFAEQTLREKEFPNLRPDQYPQPELKKYMVLTREGYKLIYNREYQTFELFDLKADPGELNNLYDYLPELAQNLKQELGRFIDIVTVLRPANADESKYHFGDRSDSTE